MSKTARKKLHRLTGRVRRMLNRTKDRLMWEVLLDSDNISERLRREDDKDMWENDAQLVRQVASDLLSSHSESCQEAIREEVSPWLRRFNPYDSKLSKR